MATISREALTKQSEVYIRKLLKAYIPDQTHVYLFGSRARRDNRWNSDYDLWIDADIPRLVLAEIADKVDESFVPFKVDIVTTPLLNGHFAERVKQEAITWM